MKRWAIVLVVAIVLVAAGGFIVSPAAATIPVARDLRLLVKHIYFFGNEYQCNICGNSMGRFQQNTLTSGELQCPFCRSRPRHRTAAIYLREHTNLFDGKPKRMLHIAPEPFFTAIFKATPNLDYLSADLNPAVAMVRMDITDIQYPDNSFDVIYCSHVLEHVPDDKKAMRELARVLRPGGWAVLAVPMLRADKTFEDPAITSPAERRRLYGQEDHLRAYGPDFTDRLRESGFDVTVDRFAYGLSDEMVRKHGLSRESVYVCRKRLGGPPHSP